MVGAAGGAAAVYETMVTLGMIKTPVAWAGPPKLPSGKGESVLILGAGIGGVTAALELLRAGYQVTILEAQNRIGGRSLTARKGDVVVEQSPEHGKIEQTCRFDVGDGLYINLGPGRLPYHHRRALHYAKTCGVALEPYVMTTTANYIQTKRASAAPPCIAGWSTPTPAATSPRCWPRRSVAASTTTG